jgi:hypothetical protein
MKMTAVRTVPTASAGTRSAPGATRSKSTIGADPEWFVERWLVPCGAAGAVLVASWLVEAKQSVSRTWRRC